MQAWTETHGLVNPCLWGSGDHFALIKRRLSDRSLGRIFIGRIYLNLYLKFITATIVKEG